MLKLYQLAWRHEKGLASDRTTVPIFNWCNEWRYFRLRVPLCIGIGFIAVLVTWQWVRDKAATEAPQPVQQIRQSSMHYLFPERGLPAKPLILPDNTLPAENVMAMPVQDAVEPDLRERLLQAIREQNAGDGKSSTY